VDHFSGQASDLGQRLKEAESNAKHDQEEARKVHRAHAALSDKLEKEASSRQAAEVEAARLREEVSGAGTTEEETKEGRRRGFFLVFIDWNWVLFLFILFYLFRISRMFLCEYLCSGISAKFCVCHPRVHHHHLLLLLYHPITTGESAAVGG